MASNFAEDLTCPECHNIYKDPVMLTCAHSVCKACLELFWEKKGSRECPYCRRKCSKDGYPPNMALSNLCEERRSRLSSESTITTTTDDSYFFKCIIVGCAGTGKTSLLHQFQNEVFLSRTYPTVPFDVCTRNMEVSGQWVRMTICDTGGVENLRPMIIPFYRGVAGALLVYDLTHKNTYDALSSRLSDLRNHTHPDTVIVLIGNKADLKHQRSITYEDGKRFADENSLLFFETSAKTGENVKDAFLNPVKKNLELHAQRVKHKAGHQQ